MNLGGSLPVAHIEIENAPEGQGLENLGNLNFKVIVDGKLLMEISRSSEPQDHRPKIVVPVNKVIRTIRVQIDGHNPLHLGAVRAIGATNYAALGRELTDFARGKAVSMSSQYGEFVGQRLVDGNPLTFMHTNSEFKPWVEVNLGREYAVARLEIDNRLDCCQERLGDFKVFIDGVEFARHHQREMTGQPPKLLIPVNSIIQYIRVQIDGTNCLHLSGLRAMGLQDFVPLDDNLLDVARGKTVIASSERGNHAAHFLVDGNPMTFMHTKEEVQTFFFFFFFLVLLFINNYCDLLQRNPWAEVSLEGAFWVRRLEIENRPEGNSLERLSNFRVFADGKPLGYFSPQQTEGSPPKIMIPVNQTIRSVRIQVDGLGHLQLGALRAFKMKEVGDYSELMDIAKHKSVSMSSQYGDFVAHRLVDGNSASFMHTNNEA